MFVTGCECFLVVAADLCLFASVRFRQVGLVYQQLNGLIDGVDLKPTIPGDPGVKSVAETGMGMFKLFEGFSRPQSVIDFRIVSILRDICEL